VSARGVSVQVPVAQADSGSNSARANPRLATHLIKKAGLTHKTADAGVVTLIQRFGSALNLNIHCHMLFLDGVYLDAVNASPRGFDGSRRRLVTNSRNWLTPLPGAFGRFLERQGLMERDIENSYLDSGAVDEDPMHTLLGHSITYRIAVRAQAGRKVFTLQTLPADDRWPACPSIRPRPARTLRNASLGRNQVPSITLAGNIPGDW